MLTTTFSVVASGTDTLVVASNFYHIDRQQNIIVINSGLAELNSSGENTKSHILLDSLYSFDQNVTGVATNSSYQVKLDGKSYTLYFTQLPIVRITARQDIVDSPSIYAEFQLAQPNGAMVTSAMGIEFRGGSSQANPKKSFELSFWNDTTGANSRDVTLLGMRTDNKYNLQALYNEPLRLSSKVSNELWQDIHQIYYKSLEPDAKNGINMQYVEVFLNGEYRGVYALSERVDRKQLKLKKHNNGIVGELYKGSDWGGAVTFTALPPFDNASETWGGFEYKHPEEEIDWSNLYKFVDFVKNSSDQEFFSTYKQKFELRNAVDYFILLNLLRASDNTGKNLYIAKYKKGEPYYYVPWDLDGVFGTDWTGANTGSVEDLLSNGFYDRLQLDCSPNGFRDQLRTRWAALRQSVITQESIMARFAANNQFLLRNNVYEREQRTWAGYEASSTQLDYTATWLSARLRYLDGRFGAACAPLSASSAKQPALVKLYPNPATDHLTVECEATACQLTLRDLQGRVMLQTALRGRLNQVSTAHLPRGMYVATIQGGTLLKTEKVLLN
ncbi:CotH kinase family protein [Hymenobacter sp. APR13]|uniref:CotH kinase family protein n=1 Tax=Hymenobacter sp. APR13 TaxID=1356852 RepID=UPI000A9EFEDD|nr:CotH kinase family protein [Hymenobacter sp. APR13]